MDTSRRRPAAVWTLLVLLAALAHGTVPLRAGVADMAGPVALTHVRVETGTGTVLEDATLVLRDGRVQAMGADVAIPFDALVIDAAGLTAVPAFIDADCVRLAPAGADADARGGGPPAADAR